MTAYCLSMILCSAVLLLLYKILLEKEKIHGFKRVYLLFSIIVSLTAPLITITFSSPAQQYFILSYISNEPADLITKQSSAIPGEGSNLFTISLMAVYVLGLSIGLFRFISILIRITKRIRNAESIQFYNSRLILLNQKVHPHSFLNNIFLNREAYLNGNIEKEVLDHELAHAKQNHSLDILFVQIVHSIFWFNPFYFLYLRAIQLNHEFLADEAVVNASGNTLSYQYLLLQKVSGKEPFSLSSPFNYSIIKKRLVMITTNTSRKTAVLKKLFASILFLGTAFLFTSKETIAQKTGTVNTKSEVPSTTEGASKQMIDEYEAIIAKHNTKNWFNADNTLTKKEQERLFEIYSKMTIEQQEKQKIGFQPKSPVKIAQKPTQVQLLKWTDSKKYFVRINGRKIDNSILENKIPDDLLIYEYYEPNKGSTDYGKYDAQINLLTKESYDKYIKASNEAPPYILVTFVNRGNK